MKSQSFDKEPIATGSMVETKDLSVEMSKNKIKLMEQQEALLQAAAAAKDRVRNDSAVEAAEAARREEVST